MLQWAFDDGKTFADAVRQACMFTTKTGDIAHHQLVHLYDGQNNNTTVVWVDAEGVFGSTHTNTPCGVTHSGNVVVSAAELSKTVGMLRSGPLRVSHTQGNLVFVQGRRTLKCQTQTADDVIIPTPPAVMPDSESTVVRADELRTAIREVMFARQQDKTEKIAMSGVFVGPCGDGSMVAFAMSIGASCSPVSVVSGPGFEFLGDASGWDILLKTVSGELDVRVDAMHRKLFVADQQGNVFTIVGVNATPAAVGFVKPQQAEKLLCNFRDSVAITVDVPQKTLVSALLDGLRMSPMDKQTSVQLGPDTVVCGVEQGRIVFQDVIAGDVFVDNTSASSVPVVHMRGSYNQSVIRNVQPGEDGSVRLSVAIGPDGNPQSLIVGSIDSNKYALLPILAQ